MTLLDELDALGLTHNTIILLTADHGDLDGAHRLHAKGATAYREQNNVPLIVVHPAHAGDKRCTAVTSHVDIAPTLVSLTGASVDSKTALTKGLPGKDFSSLLAAPNKAEPHRSARRRAVLLQHVRLYRRRLHAKGRRADGAARWQGQAASGCQGGRPAT